MRALLRLRQQAGPARRTFATTPSARLVRQQTDAKDSKAPLTDNHSGSTSEKHVTNSKDELDIHSEAAAKGKRARESGDPGISSATSQKDPGDSNKKATENTKAPGPVIGMQDERGGKGDTT